MHPGFMSSILQGLTQWQYEVVTLRCSLQRIWTSKMLDCFLFQDERYIHMNYFKQNSLLILEKSEKMYREFFSIVFSLLPICINTEHFKKKKIDGPVVTYFQEVRSTFETCFVLSSFICFNNVWCSVSATTMTYNIVPVS